MKTKNSFPWHQIPNALSVSRIGLAVVFPLLSPWYYPAALVAAFATEFFDGYLARKMDWVSPLGEALDPVADKAFFLSVGATWFFQNHLSAHDFLLLGTREIGILINIILAFVVHRGYGRPSKALALGKLTTVLQYAAFFWILKYGPAPGALLWTTAVVGVLASIQYMAISLRRFEVYP